MTSQPDEARGERTPASDAGGNAGNEPTSRLSIERAVFDQTTLYVKILSTEGVVMDANRTALEFAGAGREDVIGRPLWDTPWWRDASADMRAELRAAVPRAVAGETVRFEASHRGKDGQSSIVEFNLKRSLDSSGRIVFLIAEGHDITDRKHAEDLLRLSEMRLNGIVTAADDAIVAIDECFRITLFNRGAERIFGYRASEVLGAELDVLLPDGARTVHRRHIDAFGESTIDARRMGERSAIRGRRKNGELFPAEASIHKVDVNGERVFTAVLRDITDRTRAEEERAALLVRETEARGAAEAAERRAAFLAEASAALDASLEIERTLATLAALVVPEHATLAVVELIDDDNSVRRVQAVHADTTKRDLATRLSAYPRDAARYRMSDVVRLRRPTVATRVTDEMRVAEAEDDAHLAVLRALAISSFVSVPLVSRDRLFGVLTLATDDPDRSYGAADVALAEELARRAAQALENARLYREVQRAVQARDDVLGVVSHDLRNPLSVIQMCASALGSQSDPSRERIGELAETVRESARWAQRLIQDLLDVASIEAGGLTVERTEEDALILIARATVLLDPIAQERGIRLLIDAPEQLPRIPADPDRIVQVLINLTGNAIKFSSPGSDVVIRARAEGDAVWISVIDQGPGIPRDEIDHVFDRFWHARRKGSIRGTGLGLAIAKGIVEAHGGRLWVESEVGVGSTFTFIIPPSPAPPAAAARSSAGRDGGGKKV